MLKQEWQKAWGQCSTILFLLAVCGAQVLFVLNGMNPTAKETAQIYNQFAGPMDDAWAERVTAELRRYWPNGFDPNSEEALFAEGVKRHIPGIALYRDFTGMIDGHVSALKTARSADPGYDLSRIDKAYRNLREQSEAGIIQFGFSPGCEGMTMQFMVNWAIVLFSLVFAGNQLSADRSNGMEAMLAVSRDGRRSLFRTRFATHQLSVLMVWMAAEGTMALTLTLYGCWGHMESLVQDFIFNTSPIPWNAWQVMAVVLLCSLTSGQVIAAAAFCLVRLGKTVLSGLVIGFGVLVLPLILSLGVKSTAIALMLPCLMNNGWMWSAYREYRMGKVYLAPWQIALCELVLVSVLIGLWLRKQEEKNVLV